MKPVVGSLVGLFAVLLVVQSAAAEFRIWTDQDGKSIEAEYVQLMGSRVVLRNRNGVEIRVPLEKLSSKDQRYVLLQAPPTIDIKVSDKVDRENIGYVGNRLYGSQIRNEMVKVSVGLRKTSASPYSLKLKLKVVLIGRLEQLDRYVVLSNIDSTFQFTDKNKGLFSFDCPPFDLRQQKGSRLSGREYSGYLIAICDENDKVIAIKGSRSEFEKNSKILLAAGKNALFDRQFAMIRKGNTKRRKANAQ